MIIPPPLIFLVLTALFIGTSVTHAGIASHIPKSSDTMSLLQIYMAIMSINLVFALCITFVMLYTVLRYPNDEPGLGPMMKCFFSIIWPSRRSRALWAQSRRKSSAHPALLAHDWLEESSEEAKHPHHHQPNGKLVSSQSHDNAPTSIYESVKADTAHTGDKLAHEERRVSGEFARLRRSGVQSPGSQRSRRVIINSSSSTTSPNEAKKVMSPSSISSERRCTCDKKKMLRNSSFTSKQSAPSADDICLCEDYEDAEATSIGEMSLNVGGATTLYVNQQRCLDSHSPSIFSDPSTQGQNDRSSVKHEGGQNNGKSKPSVVFQLDEGETGVAVMGGGYKRRGTLGPHGDGRRKSSAGSFGGDDLKKRWLLYCVALDKSIMYANGIWNLTLPIALFWVVPAVHEVMLAPQINT